MFGFFGGARFDVIFDIVFFGIGDRDGDGIVDVVDVCLDQLEDKNGKVDMDGCFDGNWMLTII